MCVFSVYSWLPTPKGSISRLHLFEGFLIWGLGQPQPTVPSSIILAEEQRGSEDGVERRKKTRGDRSRPPAPSAATTTPSIFPISDSHTASTCPFLLLSLSLHLSYLLILRPQYLPVVPGCALSIPLSICLSDCLTSAPTVVSFVSADK